MKHCSMQFTLEQVIQHIWQPPCIFRHHGRSLTLGSHALQENETGLIALLEEQIRRRSRSLTLQELLQLAETSDDREKGAAVAAAAGCSSLLETAVVSTCCCGGAGAAADSRGSIGGLLHHQPYATPMWWSLKVSRTIRQQPQQLSPCCKLFVSRIQTQHISTVSIGWLTILTCFHLSDAFWATHKSKLLDNMSLCHAYVFVYLPLACGWHGPCVCC